MTIVSLNVILGVTHLLVDGKLIRRLKCQFCNFRNIHEEVIIHHIRFTNDTLHDKNLKDFDRADYVVNQPETSHYGPYLGKSALNLLLINCLFCNYRDKVEFDLSLHFLEKHKKELLAIPITRQERKAAKALIKEPYARFFAKFESPMEYRLDKAVKMAKENTKLKGGIK